MQGRLDYWDLYWRFESFRRRFDPMDFRRWKRDSQRALRSLYPNAPELLLLDATCGMGDHTVNLAEEAFRVEACDASPRAVEATRGALREAGLEAQVEVFQAAWRDLGRERPGRYDLIFHDVLHWIYDRDEMHLVLLSLRACLKPGGALVFFYADESEAQVGAGAQKLELEWADWPRHKLAWHYADQDQAVSLIRVAERGEDYIDEHHLYLVQQAGRRPGIESLVMRHVYRWDWCALSEALRRAGFESPSCRHFKNEAKGNVFALNRARRPERS